MKADAKFRQHKFFYMELWLAVPKSVMPSVSEQNDGKELNAETLTSWVKMGKAVKS